MGQFDYSAYRRENIIAQRLRDITEVIWAGAAALGLFLFIFI